MKQPKIMSNKIKSKKKGDKLYCLVDETKLQRSAIGDPVVPYLKFFLNQYIYFKMPQRNLECSAKINAIQYNETKQNKNKQKRKKAKTGQGPVREG